MDTPKWEFLELQYQATWPTFPLQHFAKRKKKSAFSNEIFSRPTRPDPKLHPFYFFFYPPTRCFGPRVPPTYYVTSAGKISCWSHEFLWNASGHPWFSGDQPKSHFGKGRRTFAPQGSSGCWHFWHRVSIIRKKPKWKKNEKKNNNKIPSNKTISRFSGVSGTWTSLDPTRSISSSRSSGVATLSFFRYSETVCSNSWPNDKSSLNETLGSPEYLYKFPINLVLK